MSRLCTLFTGQWADLPLAQLAPMIRKFGYDGVELACWGDHFNVQAALSDPSYIPAKWKLLSDNGLTSVAISNHLVGQCVCDHVDERHKSMIPAHVWGDGNPEGVRQRAAREIADTARACRAFLDARPGGAPRRAVVNGFTGSSIWHALYAFPPTNQAYLQAGFDDFAKRFLPILDVFAQCNVHFGLEVHPTEIAFDIASAHRALEAVNHHPNFGFNYDPSHLGYQGVDYVRFLRDFAKRIFHCHVKDAWWNRGDGSIGVFGGHADFGDPRRFWDFRSPGRGDVDFEAVIAVLNDIDYQGPLSVEWEDIRMDRCHGATEAAAFVRKLDFPKSGQAFDSAFERK